MLNDKMNFELGQFSHATDLVSIFTTKDGATVVIEGEIVRKDGVVHRTEEFTVACQYFIDYSRNRDYLCLMKDSGVLVILSLDLTVLDTLDLGLPVEKFAKVVFNEKDRSLLFSVNDYQLYMVGLKNEQDQLKFKRSSLDCVYEAKGSIIAFDGTVNLDHTEEKDFFNITILERQQNGCLLTALSCFKNKISALVTEKCPAIENFQLVTVPNVGIFVFTPTSIYFYEHLLDIRHHINNALLEACFQQELIEQLPNLINDISYVRATDKLQFQLFTDESSVVNVALNLIYEDPDEYAYHWDKFSVEVKKIEKLKFKKVFPINSSSAYGLTTSSSISMFDTSLLETIKLIEFPKHSQFTVFDSTIIGFETNKLIKCLGAHDNTGALEVSFKGYSNIFKDQHELTLSSTEKQLWFTKKGLYRVNEFSKLVLNDIEIEELDNIIHILPSGKIIKRQEFNEHEVLTKISNIDNDNKDRFVYIDQLRQLHINDNVSNFFDLNCLFKSGLDNMKLFAYSIDETVFTIIVKESILVVIENFSTVKIKLTLSNELTDAKLLTNKNGHLIALFSDSQGNVYVKDLTDTHTTMKHYKLSNNKLKIQPLMSFDKVLVYSTDSTFIMDITSIISITIFSMDTPYNYKNVTILNDQSAFIERDNYQYAICSVDTNLLFEIKDINYQIESSSHMLTKIVQSPFSQKYCIICAINLNANSNFDLDRVTYQLQCYDLTARALVSKYDLSSKFKQCKLSDLVFIPYLEEDTNVYNQFNFAKKVVFSKCLLVSLNLEAADDELQENLLLFTVDDKSGAIELQSKFCTEFQVTCLKNYTKSNFIACGENIVIFNIDYSIKEDTFLITALSNNYVTNCPIENALCFPIIQKEQEVTKRTKLGIKASHTLLISNIFRGLQEFMIFYVASSDKLLLQPVTSSEMSINIDGCEQLISNLCCTTFDDNKVFIYSKSARVLAISCTDIDGNDESVTFTLPGNVVKITALDAVGISEDSKNLFLINTVHGGCYFINSVSSELMQSGTRNYKKRMKLLGTDDSNSIIHLFDHRNY